MNSPGMNRPAVLVTRPAGQADGLCALLEDAGYRPVHCPMMVIEPLGKPDASQRALLQGLDQYQHIVFVSVNAVHCGLAWFDQWWPQLPTDALWYGMGESSANCLEQRSLKVLRPAGEVTTEGLLALPSLAAPKGQRVLVVKGEGGRDQLRQTLEQRGAQVDELVAYRRHPPSLKAGELAGIIRGGGCEALLLSSGEGLLNMVSLLNEVEWESLARAILVVPSARVAEIARTQGFETVVEARSASDEDMVGALAGAFPEAEICGKSGVADGGTQ